MQFRRYELVRCAVVFATDENDLMPRFLRFSDPATSQILATDDVLVDSIQWCLFGVDDADKDWLLYHAESKVEVQIVLEAIKRGPHDTEDFVEDLSTEPDAAEAPVENPAEKFRFEPERRYGLLLQLKAAGVAFVNLPFDGYGDESYREPTEYYTNRPITYEDSPYNLPFDPVDAVMVDPIDDAVESYLVDALCKWNGDSWGDGEGAFGFVFWNVEKDEITINFSAADRHEGPSKTVVTF